MRKSDISPNLVFGNYTVIKRDESKNTAAVYWICECKNCKKTKSIRSTELRKGPKCSCNRSAQLIGQTINNFKIIGITTLRAKDKSIILQCQCINCGNIQNIASNVLKSGKQFCNQCHDRKSTLIDMTGLKFGKLTVLERDLTVEHTGHEQDSFWICKCECGNIKSIRGFSLRNNLTYSCGCIKSKGEEIITKILTENHINFKKEFTFEDLVFVNKLRFDFAIFDDNWNLLHLLEFDGPQHYDKNNNYYSENGVIRDRLKDEYCKNKNIKLIRINYNEEITLERIMDKI